MTLEEIKAKLTEFEDNPNMHTQGRYSPTATDWPDSILPFSEIHLAYLHKNRNKVDPQQYLQNLALMIAK